MSASKKEEIENEQLEIEMSSPKNKTEKAPKVKKEEKTVDKKDKKETTEKKEDKAENKKEEGKKKAKEIKKIENPKTEEEIANNKVYNILKKAKENGKITYGELASQLGDVTPDQIDKVFDVFEELGVDVLKDDTDDEPDIEDLEEVEVGTGTKRIKNLHTFGPNNSTELISTISSIVAVSKIIAPVLLITALVIVFIWIFYGGL